MKSIYSTPMHNSTTINPGESHNATSYKLDTEDFANFAATTEHIIVYEFNQYKGLVEDITAGGRRKHIHELSLL